MIGHRLVLRLDHADAFERTAVDAALGMDVVLSARGAPDRVGGALHFADGAADALVSDEMGHAVSVYLNDGCALVDIQRSHSSRSLNDGQLRSAQLAYPDERP